MATLAPQIDLAEAARYLPSGTASEREAFAERQARARARFGELTRFYRRHRCRMARVHLLSAAALTLGRFNGFSATFDRIGELLMPRSRAWERFAEACAQNLPWETRDELWMVAHFEDMRRVREAGLESAFDEEAAGHDKDPTWRILRQHMEATLGARLIDHSALGGTLPYETAIAQGIALATWRLLHTSGALIWRYAVEATRAMFSSYRATAFSLMVHAVTAWSAVYVYRRGVRERERGIRAEGDAWPLLERALGEQVRNVHPLVVRFYTNPSRFDVKVSLELNTRPARFWSRVATLLAGQGLYESNLGEVEGRFRVFRRDDGSMHFVRELYCDGTLRVFDSDFVVRDLRGRPTFFEVFTDHRLDVEMELRVLENGGLAIRGRNIYFRGVRLPSVGIQVEFQSRAVADGLGESLAIDGYLLMEPRSAVGRFIAYQILRRPRQLGCIHYRARPSAS